MLLNSLVFYHKSKILLSIILLSVIIYSCEQSSDVDHSQIQHDGIYESDLINLKFPVKVNDFERVSIRKYRNNLNDISVGYRLVSTDKDITATFYITWTGLFNLMYQDTLEVIYSILKQGIISGSKHNRLLKEEETIFCNSVKGKKATFYFKFPDDDVRMISELRLFLIDEFLLKYRITYPLYQKDLVTTHINDLISSIEESNLQ